MSPRKKTARTPNQLNLNLLNPRLASKQSSQALDVTPLAEPDLEDTDVRPVMLTSDTMSFFDRIALAATKELRGGERKGKLDAKFGIYTQQAELVLQTIYLKLYQKHPWVRAAINRIAKTVTNTQFEIVKSDWAIASGEEGDPAEKKWLFELFKVPNPEEPWTYLIGWMIARFKVCGEIFLEIEKDGFGLPRNLYSLQGRVVINVDPDGELQEPRYKQFAKVARPPIEFNSDDVIHIRNPSAIGGLRGQSDMQALELTLLSDMLAAEFNKNIYTNSGAMTKLIKLAKGLSRDQAERNKQELRQHFQGARKAHAPAVIIEGDAMIEDLQESLKDVEFQEGRKENRTETLSVLGVPAHKVGVQEKFKSDTGSADAAFAREEVEPLLRVIADAINHFLFTYYGVRDYQVTLSFKETADPRRVARLVDVLARRGVGTVNEIRKLIGWPPMAGGDTIRMWEPRLGTFVDPLNPPAAPLMPGIADKVENPPLTSDIGTEGESMTERLRTLLEEGDFTPDELAEVFGETLDPERLAGVADPDFFTEKEIAEIEEQFFDGLVTEIEKIEARVMDNLDLVFEETLAKRVNPNRIGRLRSKISSGTFRVPSVRAIRGGYQAGQREVNRDFKENIKYREIDSATFAKMKARANRLSRKLNRDLFKGELRSGRLGVERVLQKAATEGWSESKTERNLKRYFTQAKQYKAREIARSEVGLSYNLGKLAGAKKSGITKGYIELGAKPCAYCASTGPSLGTTSLDVLQDYMAAHHPNPDCSIVLVRSLTAASPPERERPEGFGETENPWMAHLNYVVDDGAWGIETLAENENEAWKKLADIPLNLSLITRRGFLNPDDFPQLQEAVDSAPDFLASRSVFELLNFVEFHTSLKDGKVCEYVPGARTFRLSRSQSKLWKTAWPELVGRLLYETLAIDREGVTVKGVLGATWSPGEIDSMRDGAVLEGLTTPERFARNFRLWIQSRDYLDSRRPGISSYLDHYFGRIRGV